MSEPRDLEVELWRVYGRLASIDEITDRVDREMRVIELVLKTRSAGEKADPRSAATQDDSLSKARAKANGVPA